MSVDDLLAVSQRTVRVLEENAVILDEAGLPERAEALRSAARQLVRVAAGALAAPADEVGHGNLDRMIETLQAPSTWPTRPLALWAFMMLRRARSLMRHLLAAAEITEPAETIAATQQWLGDVEEGPTRT